MFDCLKVKKMCSDYVTDEEKDIIIDALETIQLNTEDSLSEGELKDLAFMGVVSKGIALWSPNQIGHLWGLPSPDTIRKGLARYYLEGGEIDGVRWLTARDVCVLINNSKRSANA